MMGWLILFEEKMPTMIFLPVVSLHAGVVASRLLDRSVLPFF